MPQPPCSSCDGPLDAALAKARAAHPADGSWVIECPQCHTVYSDVVAGDGRLKLTRRGGIIASFADVFNDPGIRAGFAELDRLERLKERRERDRKRRALEKTKPKPRG